MGMHAVKHKELLINKYGVSRVLALPFQMTFSQIQNTMAFIAKSEGYDIYFGGHQDTIILPLSDRPVDNFYNLTQQCLRNISAREPRWGVIYFHYDWLAAVRLQAFKDVGGFDTYIPHYWSDCDYYGRIKEAGYRSVDCIAGHVFDATINNQTINDQLAAPYPLVSWHRKYEILKDMEWRKAKNRGKWREVDFTLSDQVGTEQLHIMGSKYYFKKCNTLECSYNNNNRRLVTLAEHTSDHGRQTNSSTEEKGEQV